MRKSRLSWYKQERLIEHFVSGSMARCASDLVGVNFKTAAYYFHRLRELICLHLDQESQKVFGGEIEVNESYFGSHRKGKRGRGAAGKVPALRKWANIPMAMALSYGLRQFLAFIGVINQKRKQSLNSKAALRIVQIKRLRPTYY
jgi:transposase-like protein